MNLIIDFLFTNILVPLWSLIVAHWFLSATVFIAIMSLIVDVYISTRSSS